MILPKRISAWMPWTIILSMTCLGGFLLGTRLTTLHPSEEPVSVGSARIVVDPADLNFGEVLAQPDFEWTIPVSNSSRQDATITRVETSCGCTKVEPVPLTLPAGESRDLRVTMDLTFRSASDAQKSSWPFDVLLMPEVACATGDEPLQQLKWRLSGQVKSWVDVTPPVFLLGERSVRNGGFSAQSVELRFEQPVSEVAAETRLTQFRTEVHSLQEGGRRYRVDLRPNSEDFEQSSPENRQDSLGLIDAPVTVYAFDGQGTPLPPVEIAVQGRVVTDVQAVPQSIMFGIKPLGKTVTAELFLDSLTESRFAVEQSSSPSPALTLQPEQSDLAESVTFRLSQQIQQTGLHSTDVTFDVRHADGFREQILVPVHYIGTKSQD